MVHRGLMDRMGMPLQYFNKFNQLSISASMLNGVVEDKMGAQG
jgi:hypothetical protein